MSSIINIDFYQIFIEYYLLFNLLFITLYIFLTNLNSRYVLTLLGIFSLSIYVLFAEFLYPIFLTANIMYEAVESSNREITVNKREIKEEITSHSVLDRAEIYLESGQYSTAWLLADNFLIMNHDSLLAEDIKNSAEERLKGNRKIDTNPRYIESVQYYRYRSQNRLLDAYYYVKGLLQNSDSYSYDFLIKMESCYYELLNDYYSIEYMESMLSRSGYTDIRLYYTKSGINSFYIERLVEYEDDLFMKNVTINRVTYPYIYIRSDNKIISSGFREDYREVIKRSTPIFPLDPYELKLFSNEYNKLTLHSLYINIRIYLMNHIRYYSSDNLIKLILQKFTSYCMLVVMFLMAWFTHKRYNFIDYLFVNSFVLFMSNWLIKKIGLIISYYGLGLSLAVIAIIYTLWFIYLQRRSTLLPSRS